MEENLMQFGKYVVIGTMHVRCATAERLSDWARRTAASQPLPVAATQCGWFIATCAPERSDALPAELPGILAFGREHGCAWVLIDSDGPACAGLPVFPW
jgi:hypothetical protein